MSDVFECAKCTHLDIDHSIGFRGGRGDCGYPGCKCLKFAKIEDRVPKHLLKALADATDAFREGDIKRLATINSNVQPLVDAAIAWHRREMAKK
jgi:hypothetical protein